MGSSRRIVLVDPPFAYGRQMELEDGSRVPYDADAIEAQRERDRFPQSVSESSAMIQSRAGRIRLALADARDRARLQGSEITARFFDAALREAA